jgi:hypothetical protein
MHRTLGCAHATTTFHLTRLRARAAGQSGQGTVEYIALILLLAAVFAVVASTVGTGPGGSIAKKITDQVNEAIDSVTGSGGGTGRK